MANTLTVTGLTPGQTYQVSSSASYTADSTGAAVVTTGTDVRDLQAQGARPSDTSLTLSAAGIYPFFLPLMHGRNSDGSVVAAAAAAGKFGNTVTLGTTVSLVSEAANSNTKTDTVLFDVTMPRNYVAGSNVTLTVHAGYTVGSGTIGTHTLTAHAYKVAADGTSGADLIATGALALPATAAALASTITGTTLLPGDRLVISVVMVVQDTGASNITGNINSVKLS